MTTATLDHMISELDRDDMLAVTRYVTFLFESKKKKVSDKKAALKKWIFPITIMRTRFPGFSRS